MNNNSTYQAPESFGAPTALPPSIGEYQAPEDFQGSAGASIPPSQPSLKPQDWISKIYHPTLAGGAMTAAGIMAAPTAPATFGAGPAAASIAAYPVGEQAANWIDQARGMQPSSEGLGQSLEHGAEIEAGGRVLTKAIGMAAPPLKSAIVKGISTVFGPSTDAVNAWLENPSLPNMDDVVTLAKKVPQTLGKLKNMIGVADDAASSLLRNSTDPEEGAIPVSKISGMIQNISDNLKTQGVTVGQANKAASNHLQSVMDDIGNILKPQTPNVQLLDPSGKVIPWTTPDTMIPESTIKSVLQAVRKNINWDDAGLSATNSAFTSLSGELDKMLKTANPDYAAAMRPVSRMMGTLENVTDDLGIKSRTGQGLQPSNSTITALNSVNKATKSITQDHLNELAALTGDDYVTAAQNAKYAQEFKTSSAQGSRRALVGTEVGGTLGAAGGGLVGHPVIGAQVGGMLGGVAGGTIDKFGGPMAGLATNLIKALSAHMPTDLATRIVSSAFAQGLTPQGQQGNGQ